VPYRIIVLNVCIVVVAILRLLRDFWPCGIIFMGMCGWLLLDFPIILDGQIAGRPV
jgi:hypothetical protein